MRQMSEVLKAAATDRFVKQLPLSNLDDLVMVPRMWLLSVDAHVTASLQP